MSRPAQSGTAHYYIGMGREKSIGHDHFLHGTVRRRIDLVEQQTGGQVGALQRYRIEAFGKCTL